MSSITPDLIRTEITQQSYEISIHADNERLADGLTVLQLEVALSNCEVLERYPDVKATGEIARMRTNFLNSIKRMQVTY